MNEWASHWIKSLFSIKNDYPERTKGQGHFTNPLWTLLGARQVSWWAGQGNGEGLVLSSVGHRSEGTEDKSTARCIVGRIKHEEKQESPGSPEKASHPFHSHPGPALPSHVSTQQL